MWKKAYSIRQGHDNKMCNKIKIKTQGPKGTGYVKCEPPFLTSTPTNYFSNLNI